MSDYIKNHYGLCSKDKCNCIVTGWLGRLCVNWNSCNSDNFEELREWQKSLKKE